MPTKVKKPLKLSAWSYSRLSTYETCPARARYAFIDKHPEVSSKAMERGSKIHSLAAGFVNSTIRTPLPDELKPFKDEFVKARVMKLKAPGSVLVEAKLAFTNTHEVVDWFHEDVWMRVGIDLVLNHETKKLPVLIDIKSGKRNGSHAEQIELYAVAYFLAYPGAEKVDTQLWYVDLGEEEHELFTRERSTELLAKWTKRADKMISDRKYLARPGPACSFCPFASSKRGPCKFG